ncbi:MAG: hypothetical protein M1828_000487 [Chrysothrix sp. TS-e1954]|nr:MAG: hypothetical protein M1828_000487 [Chrysothrix sp. TS-e1954]
MSHPPDLSSLRLNDSHDTRTSSAHNSRPTSSSQPKTPANPKSRPNNNTTTSEATDSRDAALRAELESVRRVNQVIEGVLGSLEKAKGNMDTVNRTVSSASTLLDTWTRILSRTEHTQRLILSPAWNGATSDLADAENDTLQRQRAQELREAEEDRRREAAEERRRQEDERRRLQAETPKARGRGRGRAGGTAQTERTVSAASGQASGGTQRGSAATRMAVLSGYGRVRGRPAGTKRGG